MVPYTLIYTLALTKRKPDQCPTHMNFKACVIKKKTFRTKRQLLLPPLPKGQTLQLGDGMERILSSQSNLPECK